MPWEKTFDIEVAVDQAINVFWAKGFHSASLADLLKAIGINKGSFYNAFGSKQSLFNRALTKYDKNKRRAMLDRLVALNNPSLAVKDMFDTLIEDGISTEGKKGCFLVNTALNMPNMTDEVVSIVKAGFSDFEEFFKEQLRLGVERQQFCSDLDINAQSKALIASVTGLRVLSRGISTREDLNAIRDQALIALKPKARLEA